MKSLTLFCSVILLAVVAPAYAQQRTDTAVFGSTVSSERPPAWEGATPMSSAVYFHHVWAMGVDYGFFKSNDVDLYYTIAGQGAETIVVVHGCPGIPKDYMHPMAASLEKHARVVYFDRRFDGLPKGLPRSATTINSMTDDLDALRRTLELESMTLLAHGFGGPVALNYALKYPNRVKRLILVATSAVVENPVEVERRLIEALSPQEQEAYRAAQEGAFTPLEKDRRRYRILFPRIFHKTPDSRFLDRDTYYIYFDALARRNVLANEPAPFDLRAQLSRIRIPALIVAGSHDIVTPVSRSLELAKGLPFSRLVVFRHSGHFPYFEEGSLFSAWVDGFLHDTVGHGEYGRVAALGPR
jgi:proline iminopeptidase